MKQELYLENLFGSFQGQNLDTFFENFEDT